MALGHRINAGVVEVELRGVKGVHRAIEVMTDPDVAKLTRDDYAQMVGDILADTVALVALAGHGLGIARGKRLLDLGRLYLMRKVMDRLEEAILHIDRAPWLRLERSGKLLPLGRARRATPLELSRSLRSVRPVKSQQMEVLSEAGSVLRSSWAGDFPPQYRWRRANRQQASGTCRHPDGVADVAILSIASDRRTRWRPKIG